MKSFKLSVLDNQLSVCKLPAGSAIPKWATQGEIFSVTGTPDELSFVVDTVAIPDIEVVREDNWRVIKVEGPLQFDLVGIVASLATVLANARVSIFSVSTYDTDYILVRGHQLDKAVKALKSAGHRVDGEDF
jgi:hypothetical protein